MKIDHILISQQFSGYGSSTHDTDPQEQPIYFAHKIFCIDLQHQQSGCHSHLEYANKWVCDNLVCVCIKCTCMCIYIMCWCTRTWIIQKSTSACLSSCSRWQTKSLKINASYAAELLTKTAEATCTYYIRNDTYCLHTTVYFLLLTICSSIRVELLSIWSNICLPYLFYFTLAALLFSRFEYTL